MGVCCLWAPVKLQKGAAGSHVAPFHLGSLLLLTQCRRESAPFLCSLSILALQPVGICPKACIYVFLSVKKRSHRKYIKPNYYTVWYAASIKIIPWSAAPVLETVNYLSLTVSINHGSLFGGLWGRWGASRGAALLVGKWDGNTWLPRLTTAGASATPQPSERAGGLGDGGEGFGKSAVCGKAVKAGSWS